ncbi:hypothetical protein I7I53_02800 [Histoplasma capsulatum var. duboisii H88]|uniref:Uncharacterized protein n=1 Tax=Ajellomyces capsulatus (strain H88) TaxID=544711 RepID=A0A8A1LSS4_AJEC8|nr:hypothetical protein I7I53_02800 [Histoplasma capsulatum var. duboisii H88]
MPSFFVLASACLQQPQTVSIGFFTYFLHSLLISCVSNKHLRFPIDFLTSTTLDPFGCIYIGSYNQPFLREKWCGVVDVLPTHY